jgi:hypothetical protein
MATKAELEWNANTFKTLSQQARGLIAEYNYTRAIEIALQSLQFIDGMIQYERRYNKQENVQQSTLAIILNYAPVIFHYRAIDTLEAYLLSTKRVHKTSDIDWLERIVAARQMMTSALNLWQCIEVDQDYKHIDNTFRVFLTDCWLRLGLIAKRTTNVAGFAFVSSLSERFRGKCSSCGLVCDTTKETLLSDMNCPGCKVSCSMVILGPIYRKEN